MLRIFRQLRIKMMGQNKIRSYLLYALGEVLLVVIGILLALYINNLNEEKKNRSSTIRLFTEIQQDLLNDIEELELAAEWASSIDSIAHHILKGELTARDYRNEENRDLFYFGRGTYPVVISDQSFQLLTDQKDRIPAEYNEVIKSLNSIYVEDKTFLTQVQEEFDVTRNQLKSYLFDNFDWVIDLEYGRFPEEAIDFYLNEPLYKRKILNYKDRARIKRFYMSRMQEKAIENFFILNDITRAYPELPAILLDLGFDKVYFDPDPFLGVYAVSGKDSTSDIDGQFELVKVRNFAYWRSKDQNLFYGEGSLLYQIAPDSLGFIFTDDYTFKFHRNEKGLVTGFTIFNKGVIDAEFQKIEK